MESPLGIPEEPPEPLSFEIDLFPLHELLDPIPEHCPQPVSLDIDLHPLSDLVPPIPDVAPETPSLVVDLHRAECNSPPSSPESTVCVQSVWFRYQLTYESWWFV